MCLTSHVQIHLIRGGVAFAVEAHGVELVRVGVGLGVVLVLEHGEGDAGAAGDVSAVFEGEVLLG